MRQLWLFLFLVACDGSPSADGGQGGSSSAPSGQGAGVTASSSGGNAGSGGSGASGGGGVGAGPSATPLFVAQGHFARTTVSCDRGQTWIAEQSEDATARCWGNMGAPDCDHATHSARGITYGDGWFMATFGWGAPGSIRRSRDGVSWETMISDTSFAGVAFGNGVFMAGDFAPSRSLDEGVTWETLDYVANQNVRRTAFVEAGSGMFIMATDGELLTSVDEGASWQAPPVPNGCGHNIMFSGGIAYGNDTIVILSGDGLTCRSVDDGATFVAGGSVGADISSDLLWNGTMFMAWSGGMLHTSADGDSWDATAYTPAGINVGPSAIGDDGSIVAVRGGWQTWYEEQAWYRSSDGISWFELPPESFVGGHPVFDIAFGSGPCSEM